MCYNCGKQGLEERDCPLPNSSEHGESQYGEWLRARNQKAEKLKGKKYTPLTGNREDPGGQSRETSKTTQHLGIELLNDNSASVETVTENDKMELITDSNGVNSVVTTNQAPHIFKMQTDINDKQQKTEK